MFKRTVVLLCLSIALTALTACSGSRTQVDMTRMDAPALYAGAQRAIDVNNFGLAVVMFQQLESRFPFSAEAQQAQLEIIFAHYKARSFEQAEAAADRLLREQPRHPDMDYVHYLRGLINFDRSLNVMDAAFGVDPARRDPSLARQSFQSFQLLVTSYPASRYVPDAQQRMVFLRNQLARHELYVARYYMTLSAWVSAATRARTVIEQYDETPSAIEALVILHNAYRNLEMNDLADDVARVIALNHPEASSRLSGSRR